MIKHIIIGLCALSLIGLLGVAPVAALEGTEIWEAGSSIEYKLDYFQQSVDTNLVMSTDYNVQGGPFTIEYVGMDGDNMVFLSSSENDAVITVLYDDFNTTEVEDTRFYDVDPATGIDQDGDDTFFFYDTSEWEDGYTTDIDYTVELDITTSITKTYKIVGDATTLDVGGEEVKVFDAVIDDFAVEETYEGFTYEYAFSNMLIRLSEDNGILMTRSSNIEVSVDIDGDGSFETPLIEVDTAMNAAKLSEGVVYNQAPFSDLFIIAIGLISIVTIHKKRK